MQASKNKRDLKLKIYFEVRKIKRIYQTFCVIYSGSFSPAALLPCGNQRKNNVIVLDNSRTVSSRNTTEDNGNINNF